MTTNDAAFGFPLPTHGCEILIFLTVKTKKEESAEYYLHSS